MDGDRVKTAIQASGRTIEQAATSINVSREHFNRLLNGKKPIPEKYLIKLKKIGVELPGDVIKSDNKNEEEGISFYERAIKYLRETFEEAREDHRENITDLRENNEYIRQTGLEMTDSHKTYRRMVEMCLDMGIIVPNTEKATAKK